MRASWIVSTLGGLVGGGVVLLADVGSGGSTEGPPPVSGPSQFTPNGLEYIDLTPGSGPTARSGMNVSVHYTGWLTDGTRFDSSVDRHQAFTFPLGAGRVIAGWDTGVAGMRVGGKRRLIVPPTLGYGARGAGNLIPPNATLIFDVELLGVQ